MNLLEQINQIITVSQIGSSYSSSEYDKERYEEIKRVCFDILTSISNLNLEDIKKVYKIDETTYKTPKVEVRALIVNNGKILFVKEKQDNLWSLPGGWSDVGLSPKEAIIKEVKEETGLLVKASNLLAVFDKKFYNHPPSINYVYKLCFYCEVLEGTISFDNLETSDVSFFSIDKLPKLSTRRITTEQVEIMYKIYIEGAKTFFN